MSDRRPAAEYAAEITRTRDELLEVARRCPDAAWLSALNAEDTRSIGVVIDHVAHAYEYIASWMRLVVSGDSPVVNADVVDELNRAHALEARAITRDAAIAHLRQSSEVIADLMRGLRPEDLEIEDTRVRRLARVVIRHASDHMAEIEAALATSAGG